VYKKLSTPKKKSCGEIKGRSVAMLSETEHQQAAVPTANRTITSEPLRTHEDNNSSDDSLFEKVRVILGVSDEVANIKGLTPPDLVNLGGSGVRSLGDLADLGIDELIAIIGSDVLTRDVAGNIIMAARKHLFKEDPNYSQFF
jgi:transcription termination factor NusA